MLAASGVAVAGDGFPIIDAVNQGGSSTSPGTLNIDPNTSQRYDPANPRPMLLRSLSSPVGHLQGCGAGLR